MIFSGIMKYLIVNLGVTGQVVVDTSLPLRSRDYSHITSVRPLAVAATGKAQFTVKGINLSRPGTRFYARLKSLPSVSYSSFWYLTVFDQPLSGYFVR